MVKRYLASESDRDEIKKLVAEIAVNRGNVRTREPPEQENDLQSPQVYVVLTPPGGIPALDDIDPPTGTGPGLDVPGSAECGIYQVVEGDTSDDDALHAVGESVRVYNLSDSGIGGGLWMLAMRDAFGHWFLVPPIGVTAGTGTIVGGFVEVTVVTGICAVYSS